jgi:pyrimidine-nucleoside phosphorylase
MHIVDLISKKRDKGALSTSEIDWLILQYTQNNIPDYQMAAWLMAVYLQGMSVRETCDLTLAMARSGTQLRIRDIVWPAIDKHSTGGVGDKVTLVVAPLVAACGVGVGKMSGRGLGYAGGTIDKLEAIRGFRSELDAKEFLSLLEQHGLVLAGQSQTLAPADGKIYALRDVTGTIESIPLIAASIMSKKLAIGGSHLLLDVKFGSGAFMKTVKQAQTLAKTMVEIGDAAGIHTVAAITSMEQPLGLAIGNALEVAEAIAVLQGNGSSDVSQLCLHEAQELLVIAGKACNIEEAKQLVQRAISSGTAVEKLAEVVAAQGGDARQIEQPQLLPLAPVRVVVKAPHSGYIAAIHAERVGFMSLRLGAGRLKKDDHIDHRTGLLLAAKVGDYRHVGEPLAEIHARNEAEATALYQDILACYTWSDSPVQSIPLIYNTIYHDTSSKY